MRRFLKFLTYEIIIVIIIIFASIFSLFYLKLIPLPFFSKNPPLLISTSEQPQPVSGIIEVSSEIPDYTLEIENEKELFQSLSNLNIFGNAYTFSFGKTDSLKKIRIILTDEKNVSPVARSNIGTTQVELFPELRKDTLLLFVYVSPQGLVNSSIAESLMLTSIFDFIISQFGNVPPENKEIVNSIINDLKLIKKTQIIIDKRT